MKLAGIKIGDLAGKRVLVTGGSTGIGAEVALGLAQQGARVVVHYNASKQDAEQLRAMSPDRIQLVQGDLELPDAAAFIVNQAAEILGGLDGLINNAGAMLGRIPTTEASMDHFDRVVSLNARSVWQASISAHRHLKAAGGGFIINTTSIAARNGGGNGAALYGAAKSFVSNLTRGAGQGICGGQNPRQRGFAGADSDRFPRPRYARPPVRGAVRGNSNAAGGSSGRMRWRFSFPRIRGFIWIHHRPDN